jgi:trimethylamine--corrinoid protein Co-methyltransferase
MEHTLLDSTALPVHFAGLTPAQCDQIHAASLEILAGTGVRLYHPPAVDLARRGGAAVTDGNLVRFPAGLVERSLRSAPSRVDLYNRQGELALQIEGYRTYYGPGSDTLRLVDHETGAARQPLLADVAAAARLCDALPNMDFVMSAVLPADVDQVLADRFQMEVMLASTSKPILFVTYDMSGCLDVIAMAEAVAGGAHALERRPFVAGYINVTTGLRHNQEALEKLLYLSGRGLPLIYVPTEMGGVTAPITAAAEMALVNAGALVGVTLSQLQREGAPIIVPGWGPVALDMRTLVRPYSDPLRGVMAAAMAHHYRLPMFSLGGASDAKRVDEQSGAEAALTLMATSLAGGNLIHDLGYLESGLAFSFVQLALCDELVGWIRAFTRQQPIDAETLALAEIHAAGPDGEHLGTDHTLRHHRERYYPDLLDWSLRENWEASGAPTLADRARDKVRLLLADHEPEPLPAAVRSQLRAIVEHAG